LEDEELVFEHEVFVLKLLIIMLRMKLNWRERYTLKLQDFTKRAFLC